MKRLCKRTAVVFLAVLLLVSVMPMRAEAATVKAYRYVTASSLVGREKPSTSSRKKASFTQGTKLWVIKTSGSWSKVAHNKYSTTYYWVSSKYLSSNPPSSQVTGTAVEAYYYVTAKSGLTLRRGPGTNYARVSTLEYGVRMWVTEKKDGWAKIKGARSQKGALGWVSMNYLSKKLPQSSAKSGNDDIGSYIVTASTLNVRQNPNSSGKIIGKFSYGTRLVLMNHNGKWREAIGTGTNGRQLNGWVHSDYIKHIA